MVDDCLLNRIRELLMDLPTVEEKRMFGGTCFMVNDKLCVCVRNNEMLCRINPQKFEDIMELNGVRAMLRGKRTAKGYVYVTGDVLQTHAALNNWIDQALASNRIANPRKKKK